MQEERFSMNDKRNTVIDLCRQLFPKFSCYSSTEKFNCWEKCYLEECLKTLFQIFWKNSAKILPQISPAAGTEEKTTGWRNPRKWKKLILKVFPFSGNDSELKDIQA